MNIKELKTIRKENKIPFYTYWDKKRLVALANEHNLLPKTELEKEKSQDYYFFVYLSSLPVAHLSDAPRRWLVVTGDSARIQDETTENSAWFFNVLGV